MNLEQQLAIDTAVNGHNLLLLGEAGTGKSYVVNNIANQLKLQGKKVQITCSTGIACQVYTCSNACTIHHFLGLLDGRFDPKDISSVVRNNVKYQYVIDNLKTTDTLIIDECSMISCRIFESILNVCQIKDPSLMFGGMQIIFVGDFLQLPPIANLRYDDDGKYCFQHEYFNMAFPHRVILKQVMRQTEEDFVSVINQISLGNISKRSEEFIVQLNRNLHESDKPTMKLFSTNDRVDDYNRECLIKFPGDMIESIAKDEGKSSALANIQAPKTLWLKIGCPVILIQNITNKLVNGLRGTLKSKDGDEFLVQFPDVKDIVKIKKLKFTVFSPRENRDIAVREQYPLKPAFALTIHKAQGMTLDRVEVDCRDIFRCGQLGVAMSRAVTAGGLRVINFHARHVIPPSEIVLEFMNEDSHPFSADLTCCRKISSLLMVPDRGVKQGSEFCTQQHDDIKDQSEADTDDVLEDEFNNVIESITVAEEQSVEFEIPEGFKIDSVIESMKFKHEITASHTTINKVLGSIDHTKLIIFTKKVFLKLAGFADHLTVTKTSCKIPEKNIAQFYRVVHEYTTSTEYKMNCLFLFENCSEFTDHNAIVCYNIVEAVRTFYLQQKVDLLKIGSSSTDRREVTDTSRARIRYVAGYCVASLRKKYSKIKNNNRFSKTKEGQIAYDFAKNSLNVLFLLKEEENYIKCNTNEPDSLIDVHRRQYEMKKLTNVTDNMFNFFVTLTEKCLTLLVHKNLQLYGKDLFNKCLEIIQTDKVLFEKFAGVVVKSNSEIPVSEFDDNWDVNFF